MSIEFDTHKETDEDKKAKLAELEIRKLALQYNVHSSWLESIDNYGLWYEVASVYSTFTKGIAPQSEETFIEALDYAMGEWDL
jgi:hypothetical protein